MINVALRNAASRGHLRHRRAVIAMRGKDPCRDAQDLRALGGMIAACVRAIRLGAAIVDHAPGFALAALDAARVLR